MPPVMDKWLMLAKTKRLRETTGLTLPADMLMDMSVDEINEMVEVQAEVDLYNEEKAGK